MKKMKMLILLITFTIQAHAPNINCLMIKRGAEIRPYDRIIFAVAMVESQMDHYAYNPLEGATGLLQIRQVRLDDFYRRTGVRYHLWEMYDSAKAVKVFRHYAVMDGWRNPEAIARKWNGGHENGMKYKQTLKYWNKVKEYL